ncbi:unnamed protein product [Periconia digitata]|uniref:Fungal N-terminal domain-containing protein n=1 Tax=Periconia digitata TaxID=1303443 RepID=A0A9W4UP94_9PLEO|nr:unnamed protein product [Periconia digitata]
MSDVGSVVGVLSLSLQLLQSLQKYYTEFRSFHSDIDALINRAERLESILHILEKPVQKLWKDDDELSEEVKKCMEVCEKVVARLRAFQQRCGEIDHRPETLRKKMVLVKNRALWPFRKDTLRDLHVELGWMMEGLKVVLQALGLETSVEQHNEVINQTSTIRNDMSLVRYQQAYQTELLETINRNSENQASSNSRHFFRTEAQLNMQSMQLLSIYEKIDDLVSTVGQVLPRSHSSLPSPQELRNPCDQYMHIVRTTQEANNVADITRETQETKQMLKCTCTKALRRSGRTRQTSWLSVYFAEQYDHPPPCRFSMPSQRKRIAGLRLKLCRGALGYLIEANFAWSKYSISLSLTARNIVSQSSPAFALLDVFQSTVSILMGNPQEVSSANSIIGIVEKTNQSLLQLLQKREASVQDVTEIHGTWAHGYLFHLGRILSSSPIHTRLLACILSTVSFIRDLGFVMNERDISDRTTMDMFLFGLVRWNNSTALHLKSIPWKTAFKDVEFSTKYLENLGDHNLRTLIKSNTGIDQLLFHIGDSELESGKWSSAKTQGIPLTILDCTDGPLNQAVMKRSKPALQVALDSGQITRVHPVVTWQVLQWPDALELLLHHETAQNIRLEILEVAVYCEQIDVVIKLLESGTVALEPSTYRDAVRTENMDFMKIIASALYDSRNAETSSAHEARYEAQLYTAIYDCSNFLEAATILFEAGFNNFHADFFWETVVSISGFWYTKKYTMIWNWMIRHGLDITAIHSVSKLIPAHMIAETAVLCVLGSEKLSSYEINDETTRHLGGNGCSEYDTYTLALYEMACEALESNVVDECVCLCADSGCTIVSSSFKGVHRMRSLGDPSSHLNNLIDGFRVVLEHNHSLPRSDSFFQSAIRSLTFNSLSLTHTCHNYDYRIYDFNTGRAIFDMSLNILDKPMSEDEIQDIRYTEQQDIGVFEDLLEKFDLMWVDYEGSIMDFVVKEWYPHMEEVLKERDEIEVEDDKTALEQIGVVIQGCDSQPAQPAQERDIGPKYGSLDWFDQTVQKILDGTYTERDLLYYYWE